MEKLEEIEDFYKKEVEKIDKEYLEKIKTSKNKNISDREYKLKHENIWKIYDSRIQKFIKDQKKQVEIEKNKKINQKRTKQKFAVLKIARLDLNPSLKERINSKIEIIKFKYQIKFNNIKRRLIPGFMRFHFLKIKLSLKIFNKDLSSAFSRFIESSKEENIQRLEKTKNFISKTIAKIKQIIVKTIAFIKKLIPKKKVDNKPKSEDEQLADKILSQKS